MLAASAFGTNLGDFSVEVASSNRQASFIVLAVAAALAIWIDHSFAKRGQIAYWVAIVMLRAAATNVGDVLTHDLGLNDRVLSFALGVLALFAGQFTRPDMTRCGLPRIDGQYWLAMLVAGIFDTVAGDLASHTLGLYAAAGLLCSLAVMTLAVRSLTAPVSVVGYWCVVLIERGAGTPLGDALASRHAVGLGLPLAMACTCGLLCAGLVIPRQRPLMSQA